MDKAEKKKLKLKYKKRASDTFEVCFCITCVAVAITTVISYNYGRESATAAFVSQFSIACATPDTPTYNFVFENQTHLMKHAGRIESWDRMNLSTQESTYKFVFQSATPPSRNTTAYAQTPSRTDVETVLLLLFTGTTVVLLPVVVMMMTLLLCRFSDITRYRFGR